MAKPVRISLANKCQLLFGAAVVLILTAALAVVWLRMQLLVREGQEETARRLAEAWLADMIQLGSPLAPSDLPDSKRLRRQGLMLSLLYKEEFEAALHEKDRLAEAINRFLARNDQREDYWRQESDDAPPYFFYVRAIRKSDLSRIQSGAAGGFTPTVEAATIANPVEMVLLIRLRADQARQQLMLNRIYLVAAGLLAGLLAILVFWFITTRIILSPVRVLRDTAEKVSEGDLSTRSDINTGDEFEQLSGMFNHMLDSLKQNQDQLRSINKSLDVRLGELAASNVALYEANKIKGEFLANVSHELRTPLNSIVGFAEVLHEILESSMADKAVPSPTDEKRRRYIQNIITSSRRLLDLINELLDLAKIEAGRLELRVGPMSVADTLEGLVNLMRPQAEKRTIDLRLKVEPGIPLVQTDAGRFQQILFNLLSNAVKFTPAGGTVTVSAGVIAGGGDGAAMAGTVITPGISAEGSGPQVRVSVTDTGPGIPLDQHERIFEKFTQLGSTVTREHSGTGLGLAISRELARLLQARLVVDSDTGRGATFGLVIPLTLEARVVPLMPETAKG